MRLRSLYILWTLVWTVLFVSPALAAKKPRLLTSPQLDDLLDSDLDTSSMTPLVGDEEFLRRVSFDLVGRQPSYEELRAFARDHLPEKRSRAVNRLLGNELFGRNWANFWSDTVSYRVTPPTKVYLDYEPFKNWLAEQINQNRPWSEITREMVTATGTVADNPAATFIGFHQGNPPKLSTEVSRIFLGVNIQCAECHDHPNDDWKRKQFHQMAAFFGRLDADVTEVNFDPESSYSMPDPKDFGKKLMPTLPVTFTGESPVDFEETAYDPRIMLADWMTDARNPWFAKSYVNRVWTVLTGKGFYESVDNLSTHADQDLPHVHEALTQHFIASGYDVKGLFRLILNTEAYQRQVPTAVATKPHAGQAPGRLRSDEIYQELVAALGLPSKPVRKMGTKTPSGKPTTGVAASTASTSAGSPSPSAVSVTVMKVSGLDGVKLASATSGALKEAGAQSNDANLTPVSATASGNSGSSASAANASANPALKLSPQPPIDDPVKAAVNDRFGYDPSLRTEQVPPTIGQALLLMNRADLQQFIKADPASGTMLSKLLLSERDDRKAVIHIYQQVLAREPSESEARIFAAHMKKVGNRNAAFEDLLWCLVNSAEFTTKR